MVRLVAVEAFGDGKALFPTGFVKFFAEYARFRLQNLPDQSKKWQFPSLKALHRNKSILTGQKSGAMPWAGVTLVRG
jgi:hypothetical protein